MHQETEGIISPIIRDIRLREVASCIRKNSIVLDLACGAGYLSRFISNDCQYFGVDKVNNFKQSHFTGFLQIDLLEENAFELLQQWLPQQPDYITCIAFLEHIDNPEQFIRKCVTLLSPTGKIIGTTPHPRGRFVHEFLSDIYLCSRHGAKEHKEFLDKKRIENIATAANRNLNVYRKFLFGLNQLFVM